MYTSIMLDMDSYKASMPHQYPKKSEYVSSYIEARGSDDPDYTETVFAGMQYYLKEYLSKPITQAEIDEAAEIWKMHGEPFYKEGWQHILDNHGGYLPIKIEAVPEGMPIPLSNALVQTVNTDPKCWWLTTCVETSMLRVIWFMTTVATNSYTIKKILRAYHEKSGSVDGLEFKLHDFGSRGVSSKESAGMGGIAHLMNFSGTDNMEAIMFGRKYYNEPMAGFSIPASEHSTITSWGKKNELDAYNNILSIFRDYPLVACVSDSYDIYNATSELWGNKLKDKIINSGQTIVIRPDSGTPTEMPLEVIRILMDKFGYSTNSKGYTTLPSYIRVIQGDGITKDSTKQILTNMDKARFTLDSIGFGMGSGLLQQLNRDTLSFAMKTSSIIIDGVQHDVYKKPVHRGKASKKGVLGLYHNENTGFTTERKLKNDELFNILKPVYENGKILINESLSNIRNRASI